MEANDTYTSGHSQRVTEVSVTLARELGVSPDNIEKIRLAGLVHDIGKIGVKESILNKTGKLTHREYQQITAHPGIGERILIPIVEDKEILSIVRNHHERYDGTGYPDGLSGKQILMGARILAVADSYDAMISRRPYRMTASPEAALNELGHCKGTQFDPEVINAPLRTKTERMRLPVDVSIT